MAYEPRDSRDLDDAPAADERRSPGKRVAARGAPSQGDPPRGAPQGGSDWRMDYADLWALLAGQSDGDEARDAQARDEFDAGERWGGLKRTQPSAPPVVDEFRPLPAWAGMSVDELDQANLVSQLPSLTATAGRDGRAVMPLAYGWRERLSAGRVSHAASTATHRVEVTLGYDRVTARGGRTYHAALAWRFEITDLADESRRDVAIHHGGSIVFTTRAPVPELVDDRPRARDADGLALDPTSSADGAIRCEGASQESDACYLRPDARAELVESTRANVAAAKENFVRACDVLAERLRKAAEADEAFAAAIVDCALGVGVSRLASAASKTVAGTLGSGAKVVEKGFEKLLEKPKKLLERALAAGGTSDTRTLLAAIRVGSDRAFMQLRESVDAHTDAELWLLSATFAAATQAHYEAQLTEFLAQYARQVAPIGEHQRPGGGDYAEFVVWMYDPATRRKRLGYVRAEERAGSDHGRPTSTPHRQLLGWVDDAMVPYAMDRHQRLYGPVADWTLGLVDG